MPQLTQLPKLVKELRGRADKQQAANLRRFFKTGPGQYGEGDVFLGLKVPITRQIVGKYSDLPLADIQELLNSEIHEFRLAGLLILINKYRSAVGLFAKEKLVNFYLKNSHRINNWDLVDLSVYKILGDFLFLQPERKRRLTLDKLAGSDNIWERRMAMVATFAFLKKDETTETFRIAAKLLKDKHDLIHKAVGWMLREAGKTDDKLGKKIGTTGRPIGKTKLPIGEAQLKEFLNQHRRRMPRTALRYAIERFSSRDKKHYLLK